MNEDVTRPKVELPPEFQTGPPVPPDVPEPLGVPEPVEVTPPQPEPPEQEFQNPVAREELSEEEQPVTQGQTGTHEPQESVTELLNRLDKRFDTMEREFQSKIKYDNHKEKIIDDLHRELQEYKNDQTKTLMRPMIMDIILTIDDIRKLVASHKVKEVLDPVKLLTQMEDLALDLTEILSRQGVEDYRCSGTGFDSKRQRIVKTEPCTGPSMDKTVAQRIQPGYEWDTRILRQEKVDVYVYRPASSETESGPQKENEL